MCYYLCPSVIDLSDLLWIQLMAEIAILHTLSKLFYHKDWLSLDTGCVWLEGGEGLAVVQTNERVAVQTNERPSLVEPIAS